jgi:AbrB family looped-hinge helix DNA binding protein
LYRISGFFVKAKAPYSLLLFPFLHVACLVDSRRSISNIKAYEEVFVMELAKVNAHYQLTIPKSVRQKAKVRKGSYVKVDYRNGTIFIRPVTRVEEKQELRKLRQAAEKKFADVWKDEDDAVWESYL